MQAFRVFRITAVAEAISWTGLLVGMFLKHITETTEMGVWLFGRLHGALFVAYLAAALWVARAERWSIGRTLLALVASIPPLTTLLFERWVTQRRRSEGKVEPVEQAPVGGPVAE
jgi:integral membrane protein